MKSYLYHHGILGQRWGVRRFENEDGTLTAAGRKRYEEDSNGNYKPVSNKSNAANNKQVSDKSNTENNKPEKTKNDIDNKTGDKLNKKDQEKFDKLTDKYKKEGLSNEEAQKKAAYDLAKEKNLKVFRNVALATVGVAAAAGIGYAVYKNKTSSNLDGMMDKPVKSIFENKKYVVESGRNICEDTVLKMEGTPELYRIQAESGKANLDHALYVAANKDDANKYKKMYTDQLLAQGKQNINQQIMKTKKDIKIAGVDNCKSAFTSLMESDKDFEKSVRGKAKEVANNAFLYKMMGFDPDLIDACKELARPSFGKETQGYKKSSEQQYLAFNFLLSGAGKEADYGAQVNKFYGALKDKGYHAIDDLNDRGHSGYNTKAVILFDAKDVVGDITVKEIVKSGVDMRHMSDIDDIINKMMGAA